MLISSTTDRCLRRPASRALRKAAPRVRCASRSIHGQVLFLAIERTEASSLASRPWLLTTTTVDMDRASKALTDAPPNNERTWAARADATGIALTTLYNRWRGRPLIEQKAQAQQYLTIEEEKALVTFLLLMSSFRQPIRIKYIPSLAFSIARRRSPASRLNKPPSKNWAQAFRKRHSKLKLKRVRLIDWKRHEIHIYDKITE
jgi:hypothetical protein